jgi:hypothetical protein
MPKKQKDFNQKTKVLKKGFKPKFNTSSVTLCQWLKCEHDYVISPSVNMIM